MNRILTLLFLLSSNQLMAQKPTPSFGTIDRVENFNSKYVAARNIDVWLPENYDKSKKYAVLYMQDGQGLYDASITWNNQSWDVDDVITKLLRENKIKNVVVVGVWNAQTQRHAEYFPQKPFDQMTQVEKDTVTAQLQRASRTKEVFQPIADNYLKFIVTELKPFIDKNYSTYKNAENTFIAGSSMGGLISMYAICEYPTVFGGAACLSTHWPGSFSIEDNPIPNAFFKYMSENLPNPQNHKIYFDYGDQTLDALYPPLQIRADDVMKAKGYLNTNWTTRFFPGDDHSEKSWNKRLYIPIQFLLSK
jgi:enterochelin esterase-like enzyme